MVEAAEAGQIPFRALDPGVGVWGYNPALNLSRIEEYPHAKYHQDQSSGLDFCSRYTHIHTYIDFYILYNVRNELECLSLASLSCLV
jgi:hypothetical protein